MQTAVDRWLAELASRLPEHASVLGRLRSLVERDPRIRGLVVGCSVGRGAADALSDLDLNVTVTDSSWPLIVEEVTALVRGIGEPLEVLVHTLGGVAAEHRRIFVHDRSGLQLDLVVQPASAQTRPGRAPDVVALHDPDGRFRDVVTPGGAAASPAELREWCILGWIALSNCVKYLRRKSLWEALEQLGDARTQMWRLWAAARAVTMPAYGLTSVLDEPGAGLPRGVEATVPRFDGGSLAWAARHCAAQLAALWPAAWGAAGSEAAPAMPMAAWVTARLDELSTARGVDEPVVVVPHDPAWSRRFQDQRRVLADLLAPWLHGDVHHVGSTAVPALAAKPTVDLMAGVASLEEARAAIPVLVGDGWLYAPYRAEEMLWFCRPSTRRREFHLHLVVAGSDAFRDRLAFRDALRADAALRDRYAALKTRLALTFAHDREAYTDGKRRFVEETLARLRR